LDGNTLDKREIWTARIWTAKKSEKPQGFWVFIPKWSLLSCRKMPHIYTAKHMGITYWLERAEAEERRAAGEPDGPRAAGEPV
jgi:hypothetical protein